jgi:hypothetical protein
MINVKMTLSYLYKQTSESPDSHIKKIKDKTQKIDNGRDGR